MQKAIAFGVAVIVLVLGLSAYMLLRDQVHSLRADVARRLPTPAAGQLHTDVRLWVIKSKLALLGKPTRSGLRRDTPS
jgi:hypothetical protein